MEERMRNKFTKEIISESVQRYGVAYNDLTLVGNHQSYVFKAKRNNRTIFLRITHESHRTKELILAELDWINYLSAKSISVANPVVSNNNHLIEIVSFEDNTFYVVAFEYARGKGCGEYPWSFNIVELLGNYTGRMHAISKSYTPINNCKRFQWDKNNFIAKASDYLPNDQWKVIDALNSLISEIKELPINKNSYGLIHADLVACNYHIDGDIVTSFDFDESCYCWFINDIAIQLFYGSLTWKGELDTEGSRLSAIHFLHGYRKENTLDSFWLKQIPLFLNLREIILYIAITRSRNLNDLDQWSMNFMKGRRERIENRIPFINMDFTKL